MAVLSALDQSRVRYHLVYREGVPDGERWLLDYQMEHVADEQTAVRIKRLLDLCDRLELRAEPGGDDLADLDSRELYTGDINRSVLRATRTRESERLKDYIRACDNVALTLGVINFRNPGSWAAILARYTGGSLERVRGPAGTSVPGRLSLASQYL